MHKRKLVVLAALVAALAVPVVAYAATLSNGASQTCGADSVGTYHFVNNQTGGATGGTLTATFQVGNSITTVSNSEPKVLKSVLQWNVEAPEGAVLVDASSGSVPGRLVLSDFSCTDVKKK